MSPSRLDKAKMDRASKEESKLGRTDYKTEKESREKTASIRVGPGEPNGTGGVLDGGVAGGA